MKYAVVRSPSTMMTRSSSINSFSPNARNRGLTKPRGNDLHLVTLQVLAIRAMPWLTMLCNSLPGQSAHQCFAVSKKRLGITAVAQVIAVVAVHVQRGATDKAKPAPRTADVVRHD